MQFQHLQEFECKKIWDELNHSTFELLKKSMSQYSIKDLEQLSGIKAHTIRIWEQRYELIVPKRTKTNIRYYDNEQLKLLLNVSLLSKNGFKISKICQWNEQEFINQVKLIYDKSARRNSDSRIDLSANDLITAMIDLDSNQFDLVYSTSVQNIGFRETISKVVYPFLEKVGILWSIGQINPAQEHFASCLIRQKIIAAIDRLGHVEGGKRFLLFLPEGEHHEIGLLIAHYLLKEHKQTVFYLGQDLPSNHISIAIETVKPDCVLTFLVDPKMINNSESVLSSINERCGKSKLLVASKKLDTALTSGLDNIDFLHSMDDLLTHIRD